MFADGRFYKGTFSNDLIKGKGIFKLSTGHDAILIEGTFDNGICMPGQAKIQYPSGELFEGRMNMQGMRDGPNGKHCYLNGDVYEGTWHDGKRVGRGRLTFGKGGAFVGTFKDDEAFEGKLTDKSDNVFESDTAKGGFFQRGKLNGYGKARFSNGNEYQGEFRDGLFSG